jgi:hypothetical protein
MVKRPTAPATTLPIRGRRTKVPDVDQEHLQYLLAEYVREVGVTEAFRLYDYSTMWKQFAVKGSTLVLVCI